MEKIVFKKVPKSAREKKTQQIRVTTEIYNQLLKISDETGLMLTTVSSKIIKAALPFVELQEAPFNGQEEELEDEEQ